MGPSPFLNVQYNGPSVQNVTASSAQSWIVLSKVLVRIGVHDGPLRTGLRKFLTQGLAVSIIFCGSVLREVRALVDKGSAFRVGACNGGVPEGGAQIDVAIVVRIDESERVGLRARTIECEGAKLTAADGGKVFCDEVMVGW